MKTTIATAERQPARPAGPGRRRAGGGAARPAGRPGPGDEREPLLSNADLCRLLGIGVRTLQRRIAAGSFPPADKRDGRPRWKPSTYRRWLAEGGRR